MAQSMYVERKWCDKCVCVHWVEVLRDGSIRCHGEDLLPAESVTHYVKRLGHGLVLKPRRKLGTPKKKKTVEAIP